MDCIIGDDLRCTRCGRVAKTKALRRNCGPRPKRAALARGLGDVLADGLAAVGITKKRAQAVASAMGFADCGCKQRQQALNDVGASLGFPAGRGSPVDRLSTMDSERSRAHATETTDGTNEGSGSAV